MIHRYWNGPKWHGSSFTGSVLRKLHPDIEVKEWGDEHLPDDVLNLIDETLCFVVPSDAGVHRSHVVRWWVLREYGGWWVDHDVIPLQSFETLPLLATAAHRGGSRCPSWMAFPKGHWLPDTALRHIALSKTGRPRRAIEFSGGGLLDALADPSIDALPIPIEMDGTREDGVPLWMVHLEESGL